MGFKILNQRELKQNDIQSTVTFTFIVDYAFQNINLYLPRIILDDDTTEIKEEN